MSRVVFENVSKVFKDPSGGSIYAVRAATFTVEDKEFLVLVGPSGCGKSTTLRLLAGLEEIATGKISIDGQVVNDLPPQDRDIAMVFQDYALYPHMTAYENMAFGLKLRNFSRQEIQRRVGEAAEILGLTACLDRKPKVLSGGERQRVAVGRAIVRKPKVFLFDEPLSNLDPQMRVQMRTELSRLCRALQATAIYVTHDQAEAMTMADRIVVMKEGVIQQVAAPPALYHSPVNMFVAGFIGSPPMNFFPGTLEQEGGTCWFVEENSCAPGSGFRLQLPPPYAASVKRYFKKKIVLGIRPEHVGLASTEAKVRVISARVSVVEYMGAETCLYLNTGAHAFVARIAADQRMETGQQVLVSFQLEQAAYFDPSSLARIISEAEVGQAAECAGRPRSIGV